MDINEIIEIIGTGIVAILVPIIGILTKAAIDWMKAKTEIAKTQVESEVLKAYLDEFSSFAAKAVETTNQTYVEALKDKNAFDADAQKEAFNMTKDALLKLFNEEKVDFVRNAVNDFDNYINVLIESSVKASKPIPVASTILPVIEATLESEDKTESK